jgi:uncharacterized protein YceK
MKAVCLALAVVLGLSGCVTTTRVGVHGNASVKAPYKAKAWIFVGLTSVTEF